MASKNRDMIFLSASIPDPRRDKRYFSTADPVAIRDAVRALATIVIPHSHLVWGGHPAITPLIHQVLMSTQKGVGHLGDLPLADKPSTTQRITLYQSRFFENQFPSENRSFEKIKYTQARSDRKGSLDEMRLRMLSKDGNPFIAAIFIGGMEGVEEEFNLFTLYNPTAPVYPIASTGAAARIIYNGLPREKKNTRLLNDYAYIDLFRSLLNIQPNTLHE